MGMSNGEDDKESGSASGLRAFPFAPDSATPTERRRLSAARIWLARLAARRWGPGSSYTVLVAYGTTRKAVNLLLNKAEQMLRRTRLRSRPWKLVIDPTNLCTLRCPFCRTGRRDRGRAPGRIDTALFESLIDWAAPYAFTLDLFNWSEPLLHPDIIRMIQYAESRRISTRLSTNFALKVSPEQMRALVDSGLSSLAVSCDGVDQESYETYRRGGQFAQVMANLKLLIRTRAEMGSATPQICWFFVVFRHNEHLVDKARRMAMELGCDTFDTVTGFVDEHSDWLTTQKHKVAIEASRYGCPWLYKYFIVHWDGGVAPCCTEFSEQDDFFNLRDVPLCEAWNHPTYVRARSLFGRRPLMEGTHVYCENCFAVTKSEHRPSGSAH